MCISFYFDSLSLSGCTKQSLRLQGGANIKGEESDHHNTTLHFCNLKNTIIIIMMLGKRNRPPFRRTTSMTGITVDVGSGMEDGQPPAVEGQATAVPNGGYDHRSMAMVSPRYYGGRTTSGDIETPSFLTTCSLCNRRLAPCRDIFMYRYNLSSFSLP